MQPVGVEPTRRLTFGPQREIPAGTVFHLRVVVKAPGITLSLNRCGDPCSSAVLVAFWFPNGYSAGDELTWKVNQPGVYYLGARDDKRKEASAIVSDERVDSWLRMTFDSGAILEAWYVLP